MHLFSLSQEEVELRRTNTDDSSPTHSSASENDFDLDIGLDLDPILPIPDFKSPTHDPVSPLPHDIQPPKEKIQKIEVPAIEPLTEEQILEQNVKDVVQ